MITTSFRPTSAGSLAARPRLELDLTDGDRRYGWISGDRVGFVGFGDHVEAVQAAWVAHRTLERRRARASGVEPKWGEPRSFSIERRGDDDVILAGDEAIAVLVRPGGSRGSDSFGFEIRIPGHADEISVRAMAYRIYLALRSSGTAPSLRQADAPPAANEHQTRPLTSSAASAGDTTSVERGRSALSGPAGQRARRALRPRWGRRRRTARTITG